MSDPDLCYLSASEAVALFKARKLSPVELMQAVIDRAEAVEPTINAFADTYYDEAMEGAPKRPRPAMPNPVPGCVRLRGCRSPSRMRTGSKASEPPLAR